MSGCTEAREEQVINKTQKKGYRFLRTLNENFTYVQLMYTEYL